jgi:hypothetical protein
MTEYLHAQPASQPASVDRRRLAVWAGLSYIALFVLAVFANFAVRERLVDQADPAATFVNLAQSQGLVRLAIVAFIAIFVLDVFVAWALYHVFRPAGSALSSLTAWFRIVYTVFLGVALVFLYAVLPLTGGGTAVAGWEQASREAATMLTLDAFNATWLVGLVAFGIHLVLIGFMILRSGMAPRLLGVIVAVAGLVYIFDTTAYTLLSDYAANADLFTAIVAVPAVIAEGAFTLWLLVSAGKGTGVAAAQTRPGSVRRRRGPAGSVLAARAVNP